MRILFVEDNPVIVESYRQKMSNLGALYEFSSSSDPGLMQTILLGEADAIVLSLPLKSLSVLDVISEIRRRHTNSAIIVLQESPNTDEAVSLLDLGADDIICKPIFPKHLVARVRAILRRNSGYVTSEIRIGDFVYFFDGRSPEMNGVPLSFTKKEKALLECLVLRSGKTVKKDFIFSHLYGTGTEDIGPKIVDVYVCKLRKKLKDSFGREYINTIFGIGYSLQAPSEVSLVAEN